MTKKKTAPQPLADAEPGQSDDGTPLDIPGQGTPPAIPGQDLEIATGFFALDLIDPSPFQPRTEWDKADEAELTASVKANGIIEPVILRPAGEPSSRYELVAGERRIRAARALHLDHVPARVLHLDDRQAQELALVENIQRKSLSPMEEAAAFDRLLGGDLNLPMAEVVARTGKDQQYVFMRRRLLVLPPNAKAALRSGKLELGAAHLLLRISDEGVREKAAKHLIEQHPLTFTAAKGIILGQYMLQLHNAPFDTKSEDLVPAAGSCTDCPKRTANQRDLFGGAITDKDLCTDRACFDGKIAAHSAAVREKATAAGGSVLDEAQSKKVFNPYGQLKAKEYVRKDDVCYDDPKYRTYGQLLKKDAPPATVATLEDGKIVELYHRKDAEAGTKALGLKAKNTGGERYAREAKVKRAKTIDENRIREAKLQAVVADISVRKVSTAARDPLLTQLALLSLSAVWSDTLRATAAARGLSQKKGGHDADRKAMEGWLGSATSGAALALLAELMIRQTQSGFRGNKDSIASTAAVLSIDLKKVEKEARAAQEAKAARATEPKVKPTAKAKRKR